MYILLIIEKKTMLFEFYFSLLPVLRRHLKKLGSLSTQYHIFRVTEIQPRIPMPPKLNFFHLTEHKLHALKLQSHEKT